MKRGIFAVVLLLPLVLHAAGFWRYVIREASNSYQLDYGEGIVLFQASRITDLSIAYKPITDYPFVVFHYPPMYHLAVLGLSSITGSLLTAGRALSVLSSALTTLTIALLLYFCLPRRAGVWRRATAAAFAGLLPTLLVVMTWSSLARVDMLALLLSFAGMATFVLAGRRRVGQYAGFLLLVAACFTKQTAIAAPVACLLAAFIAGPRQAVRLAAFAIALGGSVLAWLTWATHGGFVRHLFLYNQNTFSAQRMVSGVAENVLLTLPIAAMAAPCVYLVVIDTMALPPNRRWRRLQARLARSRIRRLGVVASFMGVLAFLMALTYGKTGSSFNYFIEWNLVSCLLSGLVLFRAWNRRWIAGPALFLTWLVPIVIWMQQLPLGIPSLAPRGPESQARVAFRSQTHATALNLVRNSPGPVLSEDMLLLVEAGKEVPAEPAILRELAASGQWDERLLTRLIRERTFPLIVVENVRNPTRYTPAVAAAINESYVQTRQLAQYEFYEPRVTN